MIVFPFKKTTQAWFFNISEFVCIYSMLCKFNSLKISYFKCVVLIISHVSAATEMTIKLSMFSAACKCFGILFADHTQLWRPLTSARHTYRNLIMYYMRHLDLMVDCARHSNFIINYTWDLNLIHSYVRWIVGTLITFLMKACRSTGKAS